jgi:hypothetical protein
VAACGKVDTEVGAELPQIGWNGQDAGVCQGDLSDVGIGDFHVSLSITTTQGRLVALLNQRGQCNPSVFWDIRMTDAGFVVVETDDFANYTKITTVGKKVNDGQPHDILVRRASQMLSVYVDDVLSGSGPSQASFAKLPPVATGTDVCIPQDGTTAFAGKIAQVCVGRP